MTFPIEQIIDILEPEVRKYQVPVVDLIAVQTRDPFKVLVATILSARTRDEVTAAASQRLFSRARTVEELALLTVHELEQLIFPVGFFRQKARYLNKLPRVLTERFGGEVPREIDSLLALPGVGRKTANLVAAVAYQQPAICVDTHVHRIMNIWGYVQTATPVQTEQVLRQKLPKRYWIRINSLLVAFGQEICKPQRPHCDRCALIKLCPKIGVTPRRIKKDMGAQSTVEEIKLVSWNVNGLRAALKNGFLDVLNHFDADIFALQEIKVHPEQLPEAIISLPGYQAFWHPARKKGYAGTGVLSRRPPLHVTYGLDERKFDDEGRVMTLEFDTFFFINAYFPNAQPELRRLAFKQEFNRAVLAHLNRLSAIKSVILCGDLNVAHKEIDLANPKANMKNPGFSEQERAWMDELINAGYVDTFRDFDPSPGRYTWWSYRFSARVKNIGWRIDYFIVDANSRKRVLDAGIHDDISGSDHCPVSILFQ
ncbi:exodeoxyribonuclease III [Desulfobulbus alkaliphilus]|uniref:exodeoxyribonuclease III n=1 Tax=Desulfobulbus alkaliphilus TaxID=869814 RepID=UPI001964074F|nr:exodeoxyribonuclease III [Desulfobulbus alkaliphilus]MBM9537237.1 exodeoxyribonuclease III [Desulfobulbus alkaliphilus]